MAKKITSFGEWVQSAIDFGIECLDVSTGETIIVLENKRVIVEDRGDGPDNARQIIGRELILEFKRDERNYALVWPGLLDGVEDEPIDVIIVEAGNAEGRSAIVAQRYVVTSEATLEKVGPLLNIAPGANLWTTKRPKSELANGCLPAHVRVKPPYGFTVKDFAEAVIKEALERMQKGNEIPFACLFYEDSNQQLILGPKSADGTSYVDIADDLRQAVIEDERAWMYAVTYFATQEVGDKTIDIVVTETGDRTGKAPVYIRKFKVTKSLELKTKPMEYSEEIDNLWASEETDDAWEDENE